MLVAWAGWSMFRGMVCSHSSSLSLSLFCFLSPFFLSLFLFLGCAEHAGGQLTVAAMYTSSKAALNALSETLRLELQPFGVSVVTILAGTVSTQWDANNGEMRLPANSLYLGIKNLIEKWASGEKKPVGTSPEQFAELIINDVVGTRTSGKVWRGTMSGVMRFAVNWLPTFVLVSVRPLNLNDHATNLLHRIP